MGDKLSGPGAPQGPADNGHYVYSGVDFGLPPAHFVARCPSCGAQADSVQALRELCACIEPKPLPGRPLGMRKLVKP